MGIFPELKKFIDILSGVSTGHENGISPVWFVGNCEENPQVIM